VGIWKFGNFGVSWFGEGVPYEYAPEALEVLAGHGLRPGPDTRPAVVREALSDLYRFEIRRLKRRLLAGGIEKARYSDHVIELRKQYWLLSVPVERWTRETRLPDR
jgi:hypothetical protein